MSSNYPKLSEGAIARINNNEKVNKPVLQVIVYKPMNSTNGQTKYRFQMSDGIQNGNHFIIVMPELIQRISMGEFERFTVVELTSYSIQSHSMADRLIIIVSDMTVLMAGSKIGKRLDKSEQSGGLLSNINSNVNQSPNVSNRMQPNYGSPATSKLTLNAGNVCPITAITPYFNAWLIRARVTSKAPKKNWSNARGEGSVFSFDVMDQSGEIRVNAFNKECEKFFDLIQPNKVYYISKGSVKTANKRFSNLANDYEISLNPESIVEECNDTTVEIPKLRYKFIKIKDLAETPVQTIVDVIGVVKAIDDVVSITSKKTNKELKKRDITLMDNSCHEVRFTLWGDTAEAFDCPINAVIAIKNGLVGDFNGRTLGTIGSTAFQIDPEIAEANLIREWFTREGSRVVTQALSRSNEGGGSGRDDWKLLCQINQQTVNNENRSYFNVRARIVQMGRTPLYRACGQNGCLKKVRDNNNGFFHCDRCQTDSPTFEWRLILSVAINDCTGESWVTLFQDQAEKILGLSTQELSELQENNPQQFLRALSSIEFKQYVFRVGSKIEHYMDENRVKSVAYNFHSVDTIKHSKQLLKNIKQWTQ